MRKLLTITTVVLLLGAAGGAQATYVVIDDFSDYMTPVWPAFSIPGGWEIDTAGIPPQTYTYVETGLSGVVGGTRETLLNASDGHTQVYLITTPPTPEFHVDNGSKVWSDVSLVYDGGGTGLNLNASGGTKFSADAYFDQVGVGMATSLSMTVTDGWGQTSTVSRTWPIGSPKPKPNPAVYDFKFSDFTGGINWNEIDSVTLTYASDKGGDYIVFSGITSDIPSIPEPLSMVMLGCLGAGMLGARKLRRKTA